MIILRIFIRITVNENKCEKLVFDSESLFSGKADMFIRYLQHFDLSNRDQQKMNNNTLQYIFKKYSFILHGKRLIRYTAASHFLQVVSSMSLSDRLSREVN